MTVYLRPRQTGAIPCAPHPTHGLYRTSSPGLTGWWTTSAKPPAVRTCSSFVSDTLTASSQNQRPARGQPRRLYQRHRFRLGGQADRCLSRRSRRVPGMGGYQLMISADIFRGRYRESFEIAEAYPAEHSRCSTASTCPPRTTSSCPAIASWCRCSPAGSRSTTATRRPSCPTSSSPSLATTRRPSSASTTRPDNASYIELPLVKEK